VTDPARRQRADADPLQHRLSRDPEQSRGFHTHKQDTPTPTPNPSHTEVLRMAHAGDHHLEPRLDRHHDGAMRCRLCVHGHLGEDHDWCPAVEALVCEDCCRSLSFGDIRALLTARGVSKCVVTPLAVITACARCDRLPDWDAEDEAADGPEPGEPLH
jgi:hypothetical protein